MQTPSPTPALDVGALVDALLQGKLTAEDAARLAAAGDEMIVLALMAANARIASLQQPAALHPSTPSAMVPVYQKPPAPDGRRSPGQRTAISARGEQLRSRSTNMPRTASRFVPAAGAN